MDLFWKQVEILNKVEHSMQEFAVDINSKGRAVIVTTFSSHIARLSSIIEFGEVMNRKIIFCGRSLAKYVYAAEDIGLVDFSSKVKIIKYKKQMKKELEKIRGEAQKAIQQKMLEMQKEVEKMRADAKKRMLRLLTEKQKKLLSELEDKKDSKNGNRNTRL